MTWDLFWEAAKVIGLPLAMSFAAIYAFYKGWIITKTQHDEIVQILNTRYNEMVEEKDSQIKDARDGEAELWSIVKPTIVVANAVIDTKAAR